MAQEGTDLGGAGQDEGHRVVIGEEQIGPPLLLLVAQLDREHLERSEGGGGLTLDLFLMS
jgi:hypothetical protein